MPIRYTLLDAAKVRALASSTNASPVEVTTAANHGLTSGDRVTIMGHTTNTGANGTYDIIVTAVNKFTLTGSVGNGIGGATGVWANASKVLDVSDAKSVILSFDTDGGGTAAMTARIAGSIQEEMPNFGKVQSVSNSYDFINVVDLQSGSGLAGDTGFVVATADDHRLFEVNTNALKWLTIVMPAGTAGQLTVKAALFDQ